MQDSTKGSGEGMDFRLTVWPAGETGWRARVIAPDASEREFVSPFELARYLAWPAAASPTKPGKGLR